MSATTQKQLKRTWVYLGSPMICPDCGHPTPVNLGSLLGYPKEVTTVGHTATLHAIARYLQTHRKKSRTASGRAKVTVPCTCNRVPAKLFFVEVEPGQVLGPWCAGCVYYHILNTLGGEVRDDFPIYVVPVYEGVRMFEGLLLPEEPKFTEEARGRPDPPPF
jgi:hypothetical protein